MSSGNGFRNSLMAEGTEERSERFFNVKTTATTTDFLVSLHGD